MANREPPETTGDGHFVVISGRRWRATDPALPEDVAAQLRRALMTARRDVGTASRAGRDPAPARARVQAAKVALGERGVPWWEQSPGERRRRWEQGLGELSALTAAERLAGLVADTVAARSVILHGSLSGGDFRPGRSDIDLLAVTDGSLSDAGATALESLVRAADTGSATGVDLHVVTARAAAAPSRTPPLELHVGRYGDAPVEVERGVAASPDLPAELSTARAAGRTLTGAAPDEVLGPVPPEWIVDRGRHWLTTWRTLTDDTQNAAFMVLTTCRIWRFAVEREHCGKAEAARWALERDPSLSVVRQAVQRYDGDPAAVVGADGIAALIDTVLDETQSQP